jgi:hypothetical protein
MTAIEPNARYRKAGWTRMGKIRSAKLALIDLAEILLMLDNLACSSRVCPWSDPTSSSRLWWPHRSRRTRRQLSCFSPLKRRRR